MRGLSVACLLKKVSIEKASVWVKSSKALGEEGLKDKRKMNGKIGNISLD